MNVLIVNDGCLMQSVLDVVGNIGCFVWGIDIVQENGKFVVIQVINVGVIWYDCCQLFSDSKEDLVVGIVVQGVVDQFEMIYIKDQKCYVFVYWMGECLMEVFVELYLVGQ